MKTFRRTVAAVAAVSMLAGCIALPENREITVNAGEVLSETSFEYKILPWHTCVAYPASQTFSIEDGALHITILESSGADGEKWDLQTRCRDLNFKAGHKYTVSFRAKASRDGVELCSKIGNIKGDEEYCVVNVDKMQDGPHNGGKWGKAAVLTTEYQTISGTFTPEKDYEAAEWSFHYATGTKYEGNSKDGDEIWFDEMSIVCETCEDCNADSDNHYGAVSRDWSGLENNYISVNQLGYMPEQKKIAVLGDNAGDMNYGASSISVKGGEAFFLVDNESGKKVFTGKGSAAQKDSDSGDTVVKLDFSDFMVPGTYHIECGDYRSFDFRISEDVYSEKNTNLLKNAMNYFYQNRTGIDIEAKYIVSGEYNLSHKGGLKTDTACVQKFWNNTSSDNQARTEYASSRITANGGWCEAGSHGKSVIGGGMASWTLQNMYERAVTEGNDKFEDASGAVIVPETDNKIPDVLDECMYEIDYMTQMKVSADEPTWGSIAEGMIYSSIEDVGLLNLNTWAYECDHDEVRVVKPPTFAATLSYAANAAQLARLILPYDSEKAEYYFSEAKSAYSAYLKNYYEADTAITTNPVTGQDCYKEEVNEMSLYGIPGMTNDGSDSYSDFEVRDDAYWAACELFVSASVLNDDSAELYLKELESYENAYKVTSRVSGGENKGGSLTAFNWGNTASAGTLTLSLHMDLLDVKNAETVKSSILETADGYVAVEDNQGYGIPYLFDGAPYSNPYSSDPTIVTDGYEYNSNNMVLNNAIVMAYAYDMTGDDRFISGVTGAMDYLLGTNPLSYSYITGYGSYGVKNPNHRYWQGSIDKNCPYAPDGVLSSGPNAEVDEYLRLLGFVPGKETNYSQRCYADTVESRSANNATLTGNASLAWIASFLDDKSEGFTPVPTAEPTATVKPSAEPTATVKPSTEPTATAKPSAEPTETVKPSAEPTAEPSDVSKITGDVDGNGMIDVSDLTALAVALVDKQELSEQAAENADVTHDGKISLADLARLKQYISKQITSFDKD